MDIHTAKPFIKWAGGKTRLINDISRTMPKDVRDIKDLTYIEPFVGGGSVLFWMLRECPNIRRAVINDINERLIGTYRVIKNDVTALTGRLRVMRDEYIKLDVKDRNAYYLDKRDMFNSGGTDAVETAALLVFLNKTCFNGLFRVNANGGFNVSHGAYENPNICDEATLMADSMALRNVDIMCGDFEATGVLAGPGVLYYIDPPYRQTSSAPSFTAYSRERFYDADQKRLSVFCKDISERGAMFIASNSDGGDMYFEGLYDGFRIDRVRAPRNINSNGDGRGKVTELIISNI